MFTNRRENTETHSDYPFDRKRCHSKGTFILAKKMYSFADIANLLHYYFI